MTLLPGFAPIYFLLALGFTGIMIIQSDSSNEPIDMERIKSLAISYVGLLFAGTITTVVITVGYLINL